MAKRQGPYCGGKRHGREDTCELPAGWGTEHRGFGKCRKHGGNWPTVIKAAENERVETEARRALEGFTDISPVHDPVDRLRHLAGRAEAWMTALEIKVAELTSLRYSAENGEQVRGEIMLYERAMTATGRLLVDLAKLGLDERAVRVQEVQVAIVGDAMRQALAEASLPEEQRQAILVRVVELVSEAEEHSMVPARRAG